MGLELMRILGGYGARKLFKKKFALMKAVALSIAVLKRKEAEIYRGIEISAVLSQIEFSIDEADARKLIRLEIHQWRKREGPDGRVENFITYIQRPEIQSKFSKIS